jgi:hypothetical protein
MLYTPFRNPSNTPLVRSKNRAKASRSQPRLGWWFLVSICSDLFFFLPRVAGRAEENKDEPFPIVLLAEPAAWEEGRLFHFHPNTYVPRLALPLTMRSHPPNPNIFFPTHPPSLEYYKRERNRSRFATKK